MPTLFIIVKLAFELIYYSVLSQMAAVKLRTRASRHQFIIAAAGNISYVSKRPAHSRAGRLCKG